MTLGDLCFIQVHTLTFAIQNSSSGSTLFCLKIILFFFFHIFQIFTNNISFQILLIFSYIDKVKVMKINTLLVVEMANKSVSVGINRICPRFDRESLH